MYLSISIEVIGSLSGTKKTICVLQYKTVWRLHVAVIKSLVVKTGLGHAILGNFRADELVIELTEISQ